MDSEAPANQSRSGSNDSPAEKPKRKRSRGGCYTCRRRKKLCDNERPTCGSCQRLEIPCVFPKLHRNKDGTLAPSPQPNGRGRKVSSAEDTSPDDPNGTETVPEDVVDNPGNDSIGVSIDWEQINDSLGFPLDQISAPAPTVGAELGHVNMDTVFPSTEPLWPPYPDQMSFANPEPGPSSHTIPQLGQAGPSTYMQNPSMDQAIATATTASIPQFDWWVPTPLGQPGHSVLSHSTSTEEPVQPHQQQQQLEEPSALSIIDNPRVPAPGLEGLAPNMTDNAPLLLDYFVNSFSKIISVLGPTENNLLYHLLPLASASPLVMRGLVGWSAAHLAVLGEPFSSIARTSRIYIEQQLHSYERSNIDNREREEAMMAMLMLGGAEVCAGDVKGWNERLPIMRKMLISATDSEAQLTREWKGMAFNAIYHDVLSAVATTRDMALPIEQYRQLLDRSNEPDTYMGVALQVFALLAEIATIASQVSRVHKESASDKISRLIRLHAESNAVLERLNYVEPPGSCYVPDKMHLVFAFHAYRSAAELFMRQTVLRAAPTDIRTQVLVERTLLHLNLVLDTASESQMLLPLFVVGVDTVGVKPRAEVVELFNRFNARVLTGNIKTVHSLLQEVWKRNPDGDKWVDWRQIADDEGQAVSFG